MKKGPLSEEPLFCAHRARMKVSSTFSKVAGSRDRVPGRPPQRAEPPLCSHKRRRGSKGEPSPGVPPFSSLCACAPIRWEVVVTLSCRSTPFLWCLPKETVSSRQRKALFYPGGSTIRVSAPASVVFTHLRPTWGGGWCLSGGSTDGQARASTFMRALHAGAKKAPSGRTGLLSIKGRPWPSRTGR